MRSRQIFKGNAYTRSPYHTSLHTLYAITITFARRACRCEAVYYFLRVRRIIAEKLTGTLHVITAAFGRILFFCATWRENYS